ncbi:hypothetical protein GTA08_BOTSDO05859 [Neofusicoccum parvum]|nr:hypothetical protein GTA08_BOTSDO05859 [Neofusicoccum parvum]
MLEYFTYKKFKNNRDKKVQERATAAKIAAEAQAADEPKSPILNDEEEAFLERITSEAEDETPPPLPERPKAATVPTLDSNGVASATRTKSTDAQVALMDGAERVPLPQSPPAVATPEGKEDKKKKNYWAWVPDIPKRAKSMRQSKADSKAAADLASAAEAVKKGEGVELNPDGTVNNDAEVAKEKQDLAEVLDQLNLAAVNNRVFSFSKESQDLLEKFKLVLKDLVNGAPHAYQDLENLLTNSEKQLDKLYGSLPPFLQNLIKQLPTKMTAALAPEVLAAAAEKPDAHLHAQGASSSSKYAKYGKHLNKVPPLKKLVSEQGAIAALLRTILNFLKLRFPAVVTGTNVLMSLAVFILLFVFWYCHKRGRQVRLEHEASARASETSLDEREPRIVLTPGTKPPGDNEGGPSDSMTSSRGFDGDAGGANEPAITILDDGDPRVVDLPSVLELPDPKTVPLPEGADEGLGGEGKGKEKEV